MEEIQQPVSSRPQMRHWVKYGLWGIVIIIVLFILVQYLSAANYQALVQVINEDRIGVNPTSEKLDFGDLPRNKDAVRTVTLESSGNTASYVIIWQRGEIADLMKPNKNNFTLAAHTTQKIDFTVHIPNSAEYKYYKGSVMIFKIPKFW